MVNLLKKQGDLSFLKSLGKNLPGSNGKSKKKEKEKTPIKKRFPSIFKINLNGGDKKVKTIPLNNKGIVKFETDVENEYLFRPKDKGEFNIEIFPKRDGKEETSNKPEDGSDKSTRTRNTNLPLDIITIEREGPTNGTIKLLIKPKQAKVGDEIEVKTTLSAPGEDLECTFWVKIIDPIKEVNKKTKKKIEDLPQLPTPIKVFKKKQKDDDFDWDNYKWSGDDIVRIIEGGKDKLIDGIAINMDSFALQQFLSKNHIKTENKIKHIKDIYFLSVYLHTLFLYGIFDKISKNDDDSLSKIDMSELLSQVFKPYSSFLLYENYSLNKENIDSVDEDE